MADRRQKAVIREMPKPDKHEEQYGNPRRNGSINQQSCPLARLQN